MQDKGKAFLKYIKKMRSQSNKLSLKDEEKLNNSLQKRQKQLMETHHTVSGHLFVSVRTNQFSYVQRMETIYILSLPT